MDVARDLLSRLLPEISFSASRSGGPGGQNVNKVNTKITLRFNINNSSILSGEEKQLLSSRLRSKVNVEGEIVIASQEKRSQIQNKEQALKKFEGLLKKAFHRPKTRKFTKPSKTAVLQRLEKKKHHAEKKKWRQKPE